MTDDRTETAVNCPYCDRPFSTERICALHKGQEHPSELSDDERQVVRNVSDRETAELRRFRLKAVLGLVLLYFMFLFAYAVFS